jgi:glyoxylase-like metal-dependent hydrolase (beta-lactamase superfamily II)
MHSESTTTSLQWSIGDITVTRVLELPPVIADPARFIKADRAEVLRHREWLHPHFADAEGNIVLHFQAFVIETGGVRIMVDPCIGNDKPRIPEALDMLDGPFLEHLADAGHPRDSIDYVVCTHLHADHCGWNTMLVDGAWVPTFPAARYLFVDREFAHLQQDVHGDAPAVLLDSVRPVVDAGLADFVPPDHVIVDGVRLESTPGHTPGHCSVVVSAGDAEAVITGDALHHPVQVAVPHVGDNFCWDAELAESSRRALLHRVAERGALLLGSHFSGPTGVHLRRAGDAWEAIPAPGLAREADR